MTRKVLLLLFIIFLSLCSSLYPQAENDLVKIADRNMDLLDYEQAVHYYTLGIEKNPRMKNVRVDLGYAYFRLKRYEEAFQALNEELEHFPDSYDAYILLGCIYFSLKKFEEAREACLAYNERLRSIIRKKALKKGFPESFELRGKELNAVLSVLRKENPNIGLPNFILGLYYRSKGNFFEASTHFNLASVRGFDPVGCYVQLIEMEISKNNLEAGLEKAKEALIEEGPRSETYFMIGYIHYQLNEVDNAVYCFEKALELKPYLIEAMRNLAIIHYNQEEFEKASSLFDRVIRINPYDFNAELYLKSAMRKEKASLEVKEKLALTKNIVDSAEVEYKYTLKNDVQFVSNIIGDTAFSLIRNGQLNEAIGILQEYLKINDSSPELNYNLGQLHNMFNRTEKALKYALRAVELNQDFKDGYDLIGNIYFKIQDYESSLESYKEVIGIDSGDAMAHYNLGCAHLALKNFDEAERSWKKAIQYEKGIKGTQVKREKSEDELEVSVVVHKRPVSFQAHKALGRLYIEQDLIDEALVEYEKARELEPDDQEPYYELGKIYQEKKDVEKAIFYYKRYLYLGGKKEEEVKKTLKSLKKN